MRVLSVLFSLLCVSSVSAQFVLQGSSSIGGGYTFNTPTGGNPTLTLNAGNTYTFDVSAVTATTPQHPFTLSNASASVIALDATVFNYTVGASCTPTAGGYLGAGCILTLAVNANATNQTIYYKCTYHSSMVGSVNIVAVAANTTGNTTTVAPTTAAPTNSSGNATTVAPTTAAPTTVAPTTAAPTTTPVTGGTIVSNTFHITGNANTTGYIFTHNGVQYLNPTLNVTAGVPVQISFEFAGSKSHPFGLAINSSTTIDIATLQSTATFPTYISDNLQVATPASCNTSYFPTFKTYAQNSTDFCVINVPAQLIFLGAPPTFYRCARHPLMVGAINVVAAAPSSTGGSSTGGSTGGGSTGGGSTGGSSSTVAPTQKPSSTGGNSASTITLSGLTMVFALIVAMLA